MKKTGTIKALNVSPKGFYEGFLLKAGQKLVQINLPKHDLALPEKGLEVGKEITVKLEPENVTESLPMKCFGSSECCWHQWRFSKRAIFRPY